MRNETGEIESVQVPVEDEIGYLILNRDRGTVRPHKRFLIHANDRGIDADAPMLGLREKQDPATGAGCIDRCLYERVATDSKNDRVGAAAVAGGTHGSNDIFFSGVDGMMSGRR